MSNFELNKIVAAFLLAGLIAMVAGLVSKILVAPDLLAEAIYKPEMQEVITDPSAKKIKRGPEPIIALLASADIERGKKLSKACAVCHSFNEGGANKVGPNLWNIVGDKQGIERGFKYSKAFAALQGSWTYKDLNLYLAKPKAYVPGTKMSYAGMKKTKDRANLVAWLRTLSSNPKPLP